MISRFYKKLSPFLFLDIKTRQLSIFESALFFIFCFSELALILHFVPISFGVNDDTTMNAIASGAMTGEPSEFLLFTNIIIGHILRFLYLTVSNINWYTWYLILSFSLGYASIQYFFYKYTTGILEKVSVHLIILMFLYPNLLSIQFTKIAAISLAGGFILLLPSKKPKAYYSYILGVILIIIGALIRKEVFYMYLFLASPFILPSLINLNKEFIFSGIAIIIVFSGIAYDSKQYSNNKAFEEYRVFNKLRSSITLYDNPSFTFEENNLIFRDVGWSFIDYDLAASFNIDVGHPKFSNSTLTKIANNINSTNKIINISNFSSNFKYTTHSFKVYLKAHFHYLLVLILMFIWILKGNNKNSFVVLSYLIYIFGIAWMLTSLLNGNLKDRVIWSLILPLFLLSVFFVFRDTLWKKKLFHAMLILISVSVIARYTRGALILNADSRLTSDKAIALFLSNQQLDFYVSWCDLTKYNPLDLPFSRKNEYSLGWLAGSPFNKEKIKRYTGDADNGIYSINNKEIIWFFRNNYFYNDAKFQNKVCAFYLSNNEDTEIKFETIPISDKDTVYKYTFYSPLKERDFCLD